MKLAVATTNIQRDKGRAHAEAVLSAVSREAPRPPDLWALQEAADYTAAIIAWAHRHAYAYLMPRGLHRSSTNLGILVNERRLRVEGLHCINLHWGQPGTTPPRWSLSAELTAAQENDPLRAPALSFTCTHLDSHVEEGSGFHELPRVEDYKAGLRESIRSSRRLNGVALHAGDLNYDWEKGPSAPGSPLAVYKRYGFQTSYDALGDLSGSHGRRDIDYVAGEVGVRWIRHRLIQTPSDHHTLWVECTA